MTPERWARVRSAFHELVELSAEARAARLAALERAEPDVGAEVESLLAANDGDPEFLESPPRSPSGAAEPPARWLGRRIGAYRVEHVLGQGGMGVAYLARDERLGRQVTIKAVAPDLHDDPTRRIRLEREARAAAMLSHPGVAAVYALEHLDGQSFIVSEYVPGRTLRELSQDGPVPVDRALNILRQLARGLEAAHERGIVHRDLKPENVIVRDDGVVKVLDFGLAVVRVDGEQPTVPFPRLTATGLVVGTPAYMAPEQLAGHAVDARSDLYAFGVVAYELVTGRHPFSQATGSRDGGFEGTVGGRALLAIVERCLEAMPQRRYESARQVAEALEAIEGLEVAAARSAASPLESSRRAPEALWWWQFHQGMVSLIYVVAAALLWNAREALGGWGNTTFLGAVVLASVGVSYRCHLWFVSVSHVEALAPARRSASIWLRLVDVSLAIGVGAAGMALARGHEVMAGVMIAVAVSTVVAAWRIEPMTTAAAFGGGGRAT